MSKKKLSKLLALYLPYVVIGLLATNLGEAWRLAVGKDCLLYTSPSPRD